MFTFINEDLLDGKLPLSVKLQNHVNKGSLSWYVHKIFQKNNTY